VPPRQHKASSNKAAAVRSSPNQKVFQGRAASTSAASRGTEAAEAAEDDDAGSGGWLSPVPSPERAGAPRAKAAAVAAGSSPSARLGVSYTDDGRVEEDGGLKNSASDPAMAPADDAGDAAFVGR
jgi:hypothetical protein